MSDRIACVQTSPLPQKKSGEETLLPIFFRERGDVCTQARIGIIVQSFSTPNGDDDDDDDAPVSILYGFTVCRFLQRKVVISFAKRMSSCCQLQILADKLNQSSGKYFNIKAFFSCLYYTDGDTALEIVLFDNVDPLGFIYTSAGLS